MTTGKFTEHLL